MTNNDELIEEAQALSRDASRRALQLTGAIDAARLAGGEAQELREEREWFRHLHAVLGLLVAGVRE